MVKTLKLKTLRKVSAILSSYVYRVRPFFPGLGLISQGDR